MKEQGNIASAGIALYFMSGCLTGWMRRRSIIIDRGLERYQRAEHDWLALGYLAINQPPSSLVPLLIVARSDIRQEV